MTGQRNIGSVAAIGGLSAAVALLTGLPAASADELADLRANQELLQKRIDQLSQAPPPGPPGPYVPGFGPETRPATAPVTVGSFPRSFLIPGTETSLRIGGIAWTDVIWYMKGARAGTALNSQGGQPDGSTSGMGGTGNLPSYPAQQYNRAFAQQRVRHLVAADAGCCSTPGPRPPGARSRPISKWISPHANENVTENTSQGVTSGWAPRLRKAYGTMGGLLVGQETGMFHDSDADPELLDFGGLRRRAPGGRACRRSNTPIRVPTAWCLPAGLRTRFRGCRARSARSISTPLRCRPSPRAR